MARGKKAAAAAIRRAEAAHEHIDRLTTELVEAKLRARRAEERAARLENISTLLQTASPKNDKMLAEALSALKSWKAISKADHARRMAAVAEMLDKLIADLGLPSGGIEDRREFLAKRYPAIMKALTAGRDGAPYARQAPVAWAGSALTPMQEKLQATPEDLRRFQRLSGMRAWSADGGDEDLSDVWCDLLDAKQIGLTYEEMIEATPTKEAPAK